MAAQFFSSLADNALLIAAIAMLVQLEGPPWLTPLLKFFFTISYVVLAFLVGAFADSMPKGRVMFVTNTVKVVGCALILFNEYLRIGDMQAYWLVLLAYAVVGLGAAAYSPAKYGILTELLPPEKLIPANAWLESATVGSTILGTVIGGALVSQYVQHFVSGAHLILIRSAADAAMFAVMVVYAAAAVINIGIPDTGARYPNRLKEPSKLVGDFIHAFKVLWGDKLAQIALWVTTLLWGAAVTRHVLVLKWAAANLGLSLSKAAVLQGVTGLGIAIGASAAAAWVPLRSSLKVLPIGVVTGAVAVGMAFYNKDLFPAGSGVHIGPLFAPLYILGAYPLMILLGALSGFFIVPMNSILQHRGATLLSAGASIAVQNFNQNLAVLSMLGAYALLLTTNLPVEWIIVVFGVFICVMMWLAMRRHARNERTVDLGALVEE